MNDGILIVIFAAGVFFTGLVVSLGSLQLGFEPMPGPAAGMPTMLGMIGSVGFAVLFIKFVIINQLEGEEKNEC